ncbi:MAG: DNA-directed RNA polymerase subunit omega [Candidatus Omnitrophica bacterium]|nr:DNA-directed RNA polymerase subunit omega [Candidatus Omnitrophota bacterium]
MAYQPLEKLLPRAANSIYRLVLLAAKRAAELAEGMPRLVERPSTIKITTLALDEIMEGHVVLKGCEDQLCKKDEPKEAKESPAKKEKKEKE